MHYTDTETLTLPKIENLKSHNPQMILFVSGLLVLDSNFSIPLISVLMVFAALDRKEEAKEAARAESSMFLLILSLS